jgi:hypothetical protein
LKRSQKKRVEGAVLEYVYVPHFPLEPAVAPALLGLLSLHAPQGEFGSPPGDGISRRAWNKKGASNPSIATV